MRFSAFTLSLRIRPFDTKPSHAPYQLHAVVSVRPFPAVHPLQRALLPRVPSPRRTCPIVSIARAQVEIDKKQHELDLLNRKFDAIMKQRAGQGMDEDAGPLEARGRRRTHRCSPVVVIIIDCHRRCRPRRHLQIKALLWLSSERCSLDGFACLSCSPDPCFNARLLSLIPPPNLNFINILQS
eukprot:6175418-Pleurochrysis_carterae.AAC.2